MADSTTMAARVAEWQGMEVRYIADLLLRAAWCCVDEGDIEAERFFRDLCTLSELEAMAHRWQVVREWFTRVSTNLAENITGVRVVTAFNRQALNLDTFNRMQVRNTDNNVWAASLNGWRARSSSAAWHSAAPCMRAEVRAPCMIPAVVPPII